MTRESIRADKVGIGRGKGEDIEVEFKSGDGTANKKIKFNEAGQALQFGDDDSGFADFGTGGGAGTNYCTNPNFETNADDGIVVSGAVAPTKGEETTVPLFGLRSSKITSGAGTGIVDYDIGQIDNAIVDEADKVFVTASLKTDALVSLGDWTVGIYDTVGASYVLAAVDLAANGLTNFSGSFVPVANTAGRYQIRVEFTDTTAGRVLLVDKLSASPDDPAGGAGGLQVIFQSINFTAEVGKHYRCTDTVTAVQMPILEDGQKVAFSPSEGAEWSSVAITVTPAAGQIIDEDNGAVADEDYIINLSGVDIVSMTGKASTNNWEVDTTMSPTTIGNGAFVGEGTPFTPIFSASGGGLSTPTFDQGVFTWQRSGEYMTIQFGYAVNNPASKGGAAGSGEYRIEIPEGLTANSALIGTGGITNNTIGSGNARDTGTRYTGVASLNTDKLIGFYLDDQDMNPSTWGSAFGSFGAANDCQLSFTAVFPILEWANSGTTLTASDFSAKTKETALTVTGTTWTTTKATGISYRDSEGNYRLKANIVGLVTPDVTAFTGTIAGVTFDATDDQSMAVHLHDEGSGYREPLLNLLDNNASTFRVSAAGAFNKMVISFDALLASKPSWFDDNAENNYNIDVHFQEATETKAGLVYKTSDSILLTDGNKTSSSVSRIDVPGLAVTITLQVPGRIAFQVSGNCLSGGNPQIGWSGDVYINGTSHFGTDNGYRKDGEIGLSRGFQFDMSGVTDIMPAGTYTLQAKRWHRLGTSWTIFASAGNPLRMAAWAL